VAWTHGIVHGDFVRQPILEVQATCVMGCTKLADFGETSDHPGWSFGRHVGEGVEFWTKPLQAPQFPEIPGRPPDVEAVVIRKERARSAKQRKVAEEREQMRAKARKAAVAVAVDEGTDLYECDDCGCLLLDRAVVVGKQRECPHCCIEFVETDEGRNCPDCNRPFTRLVEEKRTCPNCLDSGELPDLTLIVKAGVEKTA
jgi:hypothetical protein